MIYLRSPRHPEPAQGLNLGPGSLISSVLLAFFPETQCGSPHCLILPLPRHWGLPRHLLACGTLARHSAGGCLRDKEAGDRLQS